MHYIGRFSTDSLYDEYIFPEQVTTAATADPASVLPPVSKEPSKMPSSTPAQSTDAGTLNGRPTRWNRGLLSSVPGSKSQVQPVAKVDTLPHILSSLQRNLNSLSMEDVVREVEVRIRKLLPLEDFSSAELSEDFTYLRIVTRLYTSLIIVIDRSIIQPTNQSINHATSQ